MAMDLLCPEMRGACRDGSASLGSPCSLCSQCLEDSLARGVGGLGKCRSGSWLAVARKAHCHSVRKPFSHFGPAVIRKERSVVREIERQAEVAKEGSEEGDQALPSFE